MAFLRVREHPGKHERLVHRINEKVVCLSYLLHRCFAGGISDQVVKGGVELGVFGYVAGEGAAVLQDLKSLCSVTIEHIQGPAFIFHGIFGQMLTCLQQNAGRVGDMWLPTQDRLACNA